MTKFSYSYIEDNLDDLFYRETKVINKISSFCEKTNKSISTKYKLTLDNPLQFILIITIIQNER